jgi:RNA polymerase sigma-70 factor (ECF subfamily)
MDDNNWMAEQFEASRSHLGAVAYRMLGSQSDADDAVQEAWFRLNRSDTRDVKNLRGWLTTVVSRVCLDMLRSRRSRREEPLDAYVPDPIVDRDDRIDPEQQTILADSVGLALLVVLEMLDPAERLAFVLHDMFAVTFDEIATIVDRSPEAARQLASRARRRVQGADTLPDTDIPHQRAVVDAFFAAARSGDLHALVAVLDPDVVLRSDGGSRSPAATAVVRGASAVASRAIMFSRPAALLQPAIVNGAAGVVVMVGGRPFSIMGFTIAGGRIVAIDVLADPDRLADIDLSRLAD